MQGEIITLSVQRHAYKQPITARRRASKLVDVKPTDLAVPDGIDLTERDAPKIKDECTPQRLRNIHERHPLKYPMQCLTSTIPTTRMRLRASWNKVEGNDWQEPVR
jgi:hypothetical protein